MLALATLAGFFSAPIAADETAPPVELVVTGARMGAGTAGDAAAGFTVLEAGQRVSGLEARPLAADWRVVILFDQLLSTPRVVKSAALQLADLAPRLAALGTAEIVTVGDEVALSLPATADGERLKQALSWIAVREGGAAGQLEVRGDFLASPIMSDLAADEFSAVSATAGGRIAEAKEAARRSIDAEVTRLEAQRRRLLNWLAEQTDPRPRLLILVSGGWDEDPLDFYRAVFERVRMNEAADGLTVSGPSPGIDTLGRVVSALGGPP